MSTHALVRPALLAALLLLVLQVCAGPTAAQTVRVTGATTLRYIEIRPFVHDSVAADATEGGGLLRQTPDGRVVRCIPERAFCLDVRPGGRTSTVPVIHDVEASAWGLGAGVRVYAQLRVRTALGARTDLWPRADEPLDVMAAYGEIERGRVRVRLGRQWQVSGLGFYNFDGAAVAVRPVAGVRVQAYGGRSLVRGLNEPRAGAALAAVEALAPRADGVLLGLEAQYRVPARLALSAGYQEERRTGGGLYGQLAMIDGTLRVAGGTLEASAEIDVAGANLNEARLGVRSPPIGRFVLLADARRYRPYFELWTIWGAFSPVGFDELRAGTTWTPVDAVVVRAEASYRTYDAIESVAGLGTLRTDGRGAGVDVRWTMAPDWRLDGAFRLEAGAGATRREGMVGATRQIGDGATLAVQGVAFQRLYEFRLDESTVLGAVADAALVLSPRARLHASLAAYRHLDAGATPAMDWTQRRAMLRLQWTVGSEPGADARAPADAEASS